MMALDSEKHPCNLYLNLTGQASTRITRLSLHLRPMWRASTQIADVVKKPIFSNTKFTAIDARRDRFIK